jgi:hypothetical protein
MAFVDPMKRKQNVRRLGHAGVSDSHAQGQSKILMVTPMDSTRSVLAAVDLSTDSAVVVSVASRICRTLDRPLSLIHVIERRIIQRLAELRQCTLVEARREALTRARQALERLLEGSHAPAATRIYLPIGAAVPRILSCVERLKPELLVLGEPLLLGPSAPLEPLERNGALGAATRVLLVGDAFGADTHAYQTTTPV